MSEPNYWSDRFAWAAVAGLVGLILGRWIPVISAIVRNARKAVARERKSKPRIVKHYSGHYACGVGITVNSRSFVNYTGRPVGFGPTPAEAYYDWLHEFNLWGGV